MKMKYILVLILIFSYGLAASEISESTFLVDMPTIKKVSAKLLKNTKYVLRFSDAPIENQSGVFLKGKTFIITIGKMEYDVSGTIEGALALTCHELGHAAEGSIHTKETAFGFGHVSSEEDADYWAGKVCMPEMLKAFKKESSKVSIFDEEFKKSCANISNEADQKICMRGLRGAYFFRTNVHEAFSRCNSQAVGYKDQQDLSKTPYKGKRGPAPLQCSFNNMAAGVLKQNQPKCENMVMSFLSIYNEKCDVDEEHRKNMGVEPDDDTPEASILNVGRGHVKELPSSATEQSASSSAVSK